MKTIKYKIDEFLLVSSKSAALINQFETKFINDYPHYFCSNYHRDEISKLVDRYLLLCLSSREMNTGEFTIFSSECGKGFKSLLQDGVSFNIFQILSNTGDSIYSESTLKGMAVCFVSDFYKLIMQLLNIIQTGDEEEE